MKATRLTILLLALPLPAAASTVKISSDPPGATVQLDGVSQGTAPVSIPRVSAGTHLIKVTKEGFTARQDSIDVAGDADVEIEVPLTPAPKIVEPPPRPLPPAAQPNSFAPAPRPPQLSPQYLQHTPPPPAPPAPRPPVPAQATPAPLPVSENAVKLGVAKKTIALTVETTPPGASVQIVGMPTVKPSPAIFTGFSQGVVRVQATAPGYREKTVPVELIGDTRTLISLERAP